MYTPATLNQVVMAGFGGAGLWTYITADQPEDIAAVEGYFSDGRSRGMKANDLVIVLVVNGSIASGAASIRSIVEITADGKANLSPLGAERT